MRHPLPVPRFLISRFTLVAILLCCTLLGAAGTRLHQVTASPGDVVNPALLAQNVDWMSPETARRLDLDFDVLVPPSVPAPFGGSPSVSADGGLYSLYWMLSGGSPTFLQISGVVGGSFPAGSPYDLNNQLEINASVQGYEAIHDLTPVYDRVWWIANGVLYEVNSLNLQGADSMAVANSLIALVPPAPVEEEPTEPAPQPTEPEAEELDNTDAPAEQRDPTEQPEQQNEPAPQTEEETETSGETVSEPAPVVGTADVALSAPARVTSGASVTISVQGVQDATLTADAGIFPDGGDADLVGVGTNTYAWQAPEVDEETGVEIVLTDSATGATLAAATIVVEPASVEVAEELADEVGSSSVNEGDALSEVLADNAASEPPAGLPPSDGTAGPPPPIIGGDGTGGIREVAIPPSPADDTP